MYYAYIPWILYLFANSLWIHWLFRIYSFNILSITEIHHEFTIYFTNSPWINHQFRDNNTNSLYILSTLIRIHLMVPEFNKNSFNVTSIYFKYTIYCANTLNALWIYDLFRENPKNYQSFSRIHYKFTFFFANIPRIHFVSRIHYGSII